MLFSFFLENQTKDKEGNLLCTATSLSLGQFQIVFFNVLSYQQESYRFINLNIWQPVQYMRVNWYFHTLSYCPLHFLPLPIYIYAWGGMGWDELSNPISIIKRLALFFQIKNFPFFSPTPPTINLNLLRCWGTYLRLNLRCSHIFVTVKSG
jgi:hypothetical protein